MIAVILDVVHFTCGFIVLAEALNKCERIRPKLCIRSSGRQMLLTWTKAAAWMAIAIAGAAAVFTPFAFAMFGQAVAAYVPEPSIGDTCIMFGTAMHVIRTRIKEIIISNWSNAI